MRNEPIVLIKTLFSNCIGLAFLHTSAIARVVVKIPFVGLVTDGNSGIGLGRRNFTNWPIHLRDADAKSSYICP